jgi:hypothetical protein
MDNQNYVKSLRDNYRLLPDNIHEPYSVWLENILIEKINQLDHLQKENEELKKDYQKQYSYSKELRKQNDTIRGREHEYQKENEKLKKVIEKECLFLYKIQPSQCPDWVEGKGDCFNCLYCSIKDRIEFLETLTPKGGK